MIDLAKVRFLLVNLRICGNMKAHRTIGNIL
jgi:hypothetical protein